MKQVWLIRHGESHSNAGLRTTRPADIELTPKGILQSRYIAEALDKPPSLIVVSPYLRAKQSAQPTLARFTNVRQEEWPVHEFTYVASRHYEGTTSTERQGIRDAYWKRCDPFYVDGEGAESFASLIMRGQDTLGRISLQEDEFIAIFTHGTFTRTLLWLVLSGACDINASSMQKCRNFVTSFRMPNAAITKLHFDEKNGLLISPATTTHLPPQWA